MCCAANSQVSLCQKNGDQTTLRISAFHKDQIPEAAGLFVQSYQKQRQAIPILPASMEDAGMVEGMLADLVDSCPGVAAIEDGQLIGYMGWFLLDKFRDTDRKGAYIPEWGHACVEQDKMNIYRAMYRMAAEQWSQAGCQVHALTLLAHDRTAETTWYWNGFGLTVVDAVRPMCPLEISYTTTLLIRKATPQDANVVAELDAEHWCHYTRSPVFMPARIGKDAAANVEYLSRPKNAVWLALDGDVPVGFIRYEGYDFDGAAVLESEDGVTITGAYVRPTYRGRKAAVALLDAALHDYQAQGLQYCAVNFESFNPEAATFWMKYFEAVCFSLLRVPESVSVSKPVAHPDCYRR
jgi:ribosomal protein S18 acetylase RimI-like enzyme